MVRNDSIYEWRSDMESCFQTESSIRGVTLLTWSLVFIKRESRKGGNSLCGVIHTCYCKTCPFRCQIIAPECNCLCLKSFCKY